MPTDISLEKTLPCNLEAERSILGAILLDDKAIHVVLGSLRTEDFYLESHRRIFDKMIALTADGTAIDLVTLKNDLQRSDDLESAGGAAYLASLTDGMPRAVNIEHYAQIVKEKATLRRLIQISNEMMARSYQERRAGRGYPAISKGPFLKSPTGNSSTGFGSIEPLVDAVYKHIEKVSNRKTMVTGVETGFTDLDQMTAGLHPSDLIIVAARPGLGKTSLCLNIAQFVALKKHQCVGIFSLEMSRNSW